MFEQAKFEVVEKKIVTIDGTSVDRKAIIRPDTGVVLGVVRPDYKLIRHVDVLNNFEIALKDLATEDKVSLCRGGSLMFARFNFKDNAIPKEELKKGDVIGFGLEAFNSYDGSLPVGFALSALRLVCTNGMTVPKSLVRLSVRHTANAHINGLRELVMGKVEKFKESLTIWRRWTQTQITEDNSVKFIQDAFGKRQSKNLEELYKTQRVKDQDTTVWGLYNTLTYYNSHQTKVRKGNESNIRIAQWMFDEKAMSKFYAAFGKN